MTKNNSSDWMLEGDYFEGCNCNSVCPCIFLQDPDEGYCNLTIAWHIEKGHYGAVELDELNEYTFGEMVYFFEKACGISGLLMGVNPFDQPGVEAYKKNMFALLGKPGFEAEKAALLKRLAK